MFPSHVGAEASQADAGRSEDRAQARTPRAPIHLKTVTLKDVNSFVRFDVDGGTCRLSGGERGRSYLVLRYTVASASAGTTKSWQLSPAAAQPLTGWIVPGSPDDPFEVPAPGSGECLHVSLLCPLVVRDADGPAHLAPCYQGEGLLRRSQPDGSTPAQDVVEVADIGCTVPPEPKPGVYGLSFTRASTPVPRMPRSSRRRASRRRPTLMARSQQA